MVEELRFAVRCHGSANKPKLRRHCSQCGGLDGGAGFPGGSGVAPAGEPSPNGVLLAETTVRRPSVTDDRLHYRRSARVDCDYAVDRRRTSMRSIDVDYADRRPSGDRTPGRHRDSVTPGRHRDSVADSLARSFAKV